jgi:ABC-type tungstate transport system substrate-binding protein
MVGGNIEGGGNQTVVMTTAISRYVQISEFGRAIALGILLVLILFTINLIVVVARKGYYIVELVKPPFARFKRRRENKQ